MHSKILACSLPCVNYLKNHKTYGKCVFNIKWVLHFYLYFQFKTFFADKYLVNCPQNVCVRYCCLISVTLRKCQYILVKLSNIKFNENPFSSS